MQKTATFGLTVVPLLSLSELESPIFNSGKNVLALKEISGLWNILKAIKDLQSGINIEIRLNPKLNTLVSLSNSLLKDEIDLVIMKDDKENYYIVEKTETSTYRKGPVSKYDVDSVLLPIISYFTIMKEKEINLYP